VWNRTVSEDELPAHAAVAGDAADSLLAYYKRRDPAASPSDRLITALTASNFSVRSVLVAERKAAAAKHPSGCTTSTGRRPRSASG
jgi:para-nitrobenzyl esterase